MLEELSPHLEDPASKTEMKFLLLEQKYLESLGSGHTMDALKVTRLLWPSSITVLCRFSS